MSLEMLGTAQQHSVYYEQTISGLGIQDCSVDYWLHPKTLESDSPVLVLPGLGEAPSTIKLLVEELHSLPLVVVDLHFPCSSPKGIEETIQAAPLAVAKDINRLLKRYEATPLDLAGDSTGAAIALKAVHDDPDQWRDLALITPLGLTNESLGSTITERRQELMARINRNKKKLRKADNPHPDDMINRVPHDTPTIKRAEFTLRLEWAVQQDGVRILQELVERGSGELARYIGITAASDDTVFPPDQIQQSLQRLRRKHIVDYKEAQGPHLGWLAPRARKRLRQGIERLPKLKR